MPKNKMTTKEKRYKIHRFDKTKLFFFLLFFVLICFGKINVSANSNWHKYGPVIHACGEYQGYNYTNSKEALLNTLKVRKTQKKLPIEIDFMLTSDGVPVCVHDWTHHNHSNSKNSNRRLSLHAFKKSHTKGGFTPMTARQAIDILAKTRNAYLVIDTKEEKNDIYKKLVKVCRDSGHPSFLKRIIIQLYHFEDYQKIKRTYPFSHWLFSAYKVGCSTPKQIKNIVKKTQKLKLDALVMPYTSFVKENKNHYRMRDNNITAVNRGRHTPLIIHTINSRRLYNALRLNKINGIYTDNPNW